MAHGEGSTHGGFPVVDPEGRLRGLVTRRDLLDPATPASDPVADRIARPAVTVREDATLRQAADLMVQEGVGRLPVLDAAGSLVGIVTRSDLLAAHGPRVRAHGMRERTIHLGRTQP